MGFHKLICYADTSYPLRRKKIKWHQIFIIVDLLRCPLRAQWNAKMIETFDVDNDFSKANHSYFLGAKKRIIQSRVCCFHFNVCNNNHHKTCVFCNCYENLLCSCTNRSDWLKKRNRKKNTFHNARAFEWLSQNYNDTKKMQNLIQLSHFWVVQCLSIWHWILLKCDEINLLLCLHESLHSN